MADPLTTPILRTVANKPGVVYDAAKTKVIFAEDINTIGGALDNHEERIQDLESAGPGGASAFTELSDVPASYTDQGGKFVSVKEDESGLEFVPAPEGGGGIFLEQKFNLFPIFSSSFGYISVASAQYSGVIGRIVTTGSINNKAVIAGYGGTLVVNSPYFVPFGWCAKIAFQNISSVSASVGLGDSDIIYGGEGAFFRFLDGNIYAVSRYYDVNEGDYFEHTALLVSSYTGSVVELAIVQNLDTGKFDFYIGQTLVASLDNDISGEDVSFFYHFCVKTLTSSSRNMDIASFGLMPF